MEKSVSIFIPAFNEGKLLADTITTIERIRVKNGFRSELVEYIVVDDGSTDDTGAIADHLARQYPNLKVIHNGRNRGLGYNYEAALKQATKDYFLLIPGDDETEKLTICIILQSIQKHERDIFVSYQANQEVRPFKRRIISHTYTAAMNFLFKMNLRYFNGLNAIKISQLRKAKLMTDGPSYMAGILIQLIKQHRATYLQIPMFVKSQPGRKSRLLKWKNVLRVIKHVHDLKKLLRETPST